MSSETFAKLVEASGLSPLFASNSIARACRRAGVEPDNMGPDDVSRVVPEVQRAIRGFLDDAVRSDVFAALDALAKRA